LLAGDVALLAEHDGNAALGEEESGAGADDAAADDDDGGTRRQRVVGRNRIDARPHYAAATPLARRDGAPSKAAWRRASPSLAPVLLDPEASSSG